jgi:hypothetical protein
MKIFTLVVDDSKDPIEVTFINTLSASEAFSIIQKMVIDERVKREIEKANAVKPV